VFDDIGKNIDTEARKRRALSAGLTTSLLTALVGFSIGLAMYTVVEDSGTAPEADLLVWFADPEPEELPRPPAPPLLPAGTDSAATASDPDEVAEPEDLKPVPTEPITPKKTSGTDQGSANGRPDGKASGVSDGQGTSDGGFSGGRPQLITHRELVRSRPVDPRYPKAAKGHYPDRVTCTVELHIDKKGKPTSAVVKNCPVIFHESARDAMLKSRWWPPKNSSGDRVDARTLIVIHYVAR